MNAITTNSTSSPFPTPPESEWNRKRHRSNDSPEQPSADEESGSSAKHFKENGRQDEPPLHSYAAIDQDDPHKSAILKQLKKLKTVRLINSDLVHMNEYENCIANNALPFGLAVTEIPKLGKGLFLKPSAKPILKDQFLGCYAGRIRMFTNEEGLDNSFRWALSTVKRLGIMYNIDIDATEKFNFTIYLNHSETEFNVKVKGLIQKKGVSQVVFLAAKDINPGQMLLLNYGPHYNWGTLGIEPIRLTPDTYKMQQDEEIPKQLKNLANTRD